MVALLYPPQRYRCVTIRGEPGIGKTAVALRACEYMVRAWDGWGMAVYGRVWSGVSPSTSWGLGLKAKKGEKGGGGR